MTTFPKAGFQLVADGLDDFESAIDDANSAVNDFSNDLASNIADINNAFSDLLEGVQDLAQGVTDAFDEISNNSLDLNENTSNNYKSVSVKTVALGNIIADITSGIASGFVSMASKSVEALTWVGEKMTGLAVIAGETAISVESAFAGVAKTTDGLIDEFGRLTTEGEFSGEAIRNEFRQLATEVPASLEEILEVGAIAGQLGIAKDQLVEFTRTAINLGETTNVTAEDAATALAKINSVYQVSVKDMALVTEQMGSSLVDLGNNFAANESEILNFVQRIAGAGNVAGLSQADLLALGTAAVAAGQRVEAGGTVIQETFLKFAEAADSAGEVVVNNTSAIAENEADLADKTDDLYVARLKLHAIQVKNAEALDKYGQVASNNIATEFERAKKVKALEAEIASLNGATQDLIATDGQLSFTSSKELQVLTQVTNQAIAANEDLQKEFGTTAFSAQEFADLIGQDSVRAFQLFLEGLEPMGIEGVKILEELDLGGTRAKSALLALTGASDVLADAIGVSRDAFEENVALVKEAEIRYGTTAARIDIFKNRLRDVALIAGDKLLPSLNKLIDIAEPIITELGTKLPDVLNKFLVPTLDKVTSSIATLAGGFGFALPTVEGETPTFEPISMEVLGIDTTAVSTFTDTLRSLRDTFTEIGQQALPKLQEAFDNLRAFWNEFGPQLQQIVSETFAEFGVIYEEQATELIPFLLDALVKLSEWFLENGPMMVEITKKVSSMFIFLMKVIRKLWSVAIPILSDIIDFIFSISTTMNTAMGTDYGKLFKDNFEAIKKIVENTWKAVKSKTLNKIAEVITAIKTKVVEIVETWKGNWNNLVIIVTTIWDNIKTKITEKIEEIKTSISTKIEEVKTAISTKIEEIAEAMGIDLEEFVARWESIGERIRVIVTTIFDRIKTRVADKIEEIKTEWLDRWNKLVLIVSTVWNNISTTISDAWNSVVEWITTEIDKFITTWEEHWNDFKLIVTTVWDEIKLAIQDAWNSIVEWFTTEFEEFKITWESNWNNFKLIVTTVWDEIKTSISTKIDEIITDLTGKVEKFVQIGRDIANGIKQGIAESGGKLLEFITGTTEDSVTAVEEALDISSPSQVFATIGQNVIEGFIQGLSASGMSPKEQLLLLFSGLGEAIMTNFQILLEQWSLNWQTLIAIGSESLGQLTEIFMINFTLVSDWIVEWFGRTEFWLLEKREAFFNIAFEWVNAMIAAFFEQAQLLSETVATVLGETITIALTFVPGFYNAGVQLMEGMKEGVKSAVQPMIDEVIAGIRAAIEAAKAELGVASPSKVFEGIGETLPQGMAVGISSQKQAPIMAMSDVISGIVTPNQITGNGNATTNNDNSFNVQMNNTFAPQSPTKIVEDLSMLASMRGI